MNLLQSIHLATVQGTGLRFPDGTEAFLGVLEPIIMVRLPGGSFEQWRNEGLYKAINARLNNTKPEADDSPHQKVIPCSWAIVEAGDPTVRKDSTIVSRDGIGWVTIEVTGLDRNNQPTRIRHSFPPQEWPALKEAIELALKP